MRPRIRCNLLGCATDANACERCGTDLYDADFVQIGRLDFAFRAYASWLRWKITNALFWLGLVVAPRGGAKALLCKYLVDYGDEIQRVINESSEGRDG